MGLDNELVEFGVYGGWVAWMVGGRSKAGAAEVRHLTSLEACAEDGYEAYRCLF